MFPQGDGLLVSTVGMRKGYHFLWKVNGRVTFSVKSGILKGESLDLGKGGEASP